MATYYSVGNGWEATYTNIDGVVSGISGSFSGSKTYQGMSVTASGSLTNTGWVGKWSETGGGPPPNPAIQSGTWTQAVGSDGGPVSDIGGYILLNPGALGYVSYIDRGPVTTCETLEIYISSPTVVYDGQYHPATITTVPANVPIVVTYNDYFFEPKNAGNYSILVVANQSPYCGDNFGMQIISPVSVSITIGNLEQTYNGNPLQVSVSLNPATDVGTGEPISYLVTYNGSKDLPINAGSYDVVVTLNNLNYTGTETATLKINKVLSQVTIGNLTQTWVGSPLPVSVTTNPTANYDVTYNGSSTIPIAIGSYNVEVTINDANYYGGGTATEKIVCNPAIPAIDGLLQYFSGAPCPVQITIGNITTSFTTTYQNIFDEVGKPINQPTTTPPTLIGRYRVVINFDTSPCIQELITWMSILPASGRVSALKVADGVWRYCNYGKVFTAGTSDDLYQQVYEYRLANGLDVTTTVADVDAFLSTLESQLAGKGYLQSLPPCKNSCY